MRGTTFDKALILLLAVIAVGLVMTEGVIWGVLPAITVALAMWAGSK